jgi:hypothetical protein
MLEKYTRQIRLPEIGEPGQARLCAATVHVKSRGVAGDVCARYLRGAGVRVALENSQGDGEAGRIDGLENSFPSPRLPVQSLSDQAARDVAEGAHEALVAMRAILGMES